MSANTPFFTIAKGCRICGGKIESIYNLGNLASSGSFPASKLENVPVGPLEIGKCLNCGLTQLCHDFDKSVLYTDKYGYRSGINETMVTHLTNLATDILEVLIKLPDKDKTFIDIGSNDGTFLKQIKKINQGPIRLIGVDPSTSDFKDEYHAAGMELITELFDLNLANGKLGGVKADVITSIAMFYDLEDPVGFAEGISKLLKPEGFWVLEQSYLPTMIENNAFDTICHEHLEYYTLNDIKNVCEKVGLRVFKVEFNSSNGASFRSYVCHQNSRIHETENLVSSTLEAELQYVKDRKRLDEFFLGISEIRICVLETLEKIKDEGKSIHGYGASTKGNTLLQYFNIDENFIPFIADRNPMKFGKFTPGKLIPIISENQSRELSPDYYFVLPWHFKNAILKRELEINSKRKFIFPFPRLEII